MYTEQFAYMAGDTYGDQVRVGAGGGGVLETQFSVQVSSGNLSGQY